MTIKGPVLFITIIVFFACANKDSQSISYFIERRDSNFILEIDTADTYYLKAKSWEHKLQLTNIENGLKGFEMRLWYNPELLFRKKLITIKYSEGTWESKAYIITDNGVVGFNHYPIDSVVILQPKSGWKIFQHKLSKLQINQLPNYSYSPGDNLLDDGITYFAEVANQGSYRFSWFTNPQPNVENNKNAQQWQSVVNLFNEEFDIY